jgi:hypothetical protein
MTYNAQTGFDGNDGALNSAPNAVDEPEIQKDFPPLPDEPQPDEQVTPEPKVKPVPDFKVMLGGEEFTIEEPDTETVLEFLKLASTIGLRGEQHVTAYFKGLYTAIISNKKGTQSVSKPSTSALAMGFIKVLEMSDLEKLTVLAFFGGEADANKAGKRWLESKGRKVIKLGPLTNALLFRIAQSEDLRDAVKNLQGAGDLIPELDGLMAMPEPTPEREQTALSA